MAEQEKLIKGILSKIYGERVVSEVLFYNDDLRYTLLNIFETFKIGEDALIYLQKSSGNESKFEQNKEIDQALIFSSETLMVIDFENDEKGSSAIRVFKNFKNAYITFINRDRHDIKPETVQIKLPDGEIELSKDRSIDYRALSTILEEIMKL